MTTEAELLDDIEGNDEPDKTDEKTETQPAESTENPATEENAAPKEGEGVEQDGAELQHSDGGNESEVHSGEGDSVSQTEEPRQDSNDEATGGGGVAEIVEPKNELMSPADLARKQKFENWQLGFNQKLGTHIVINVDGVVEISGASLEEIERALQIVSETELTSNSISDNMRLAVAEFILELSARNNEDHAQTASRYNICEMIGRKIHSLYRWVRVVEEIPKSKLKYGLFMTQYEAVACIRHPKDKKNDKKFIDARNKILDNAANNPKEYGAKQMSNELKAVVDKLDNSTKGGLDSKRITPAKSQPIMIESLNSYRIIYAAAVNPDILDEIGVTKDQLNNIITSNEALLIERDILNPDLTTITFIPDVIEGDEEEEKEPIDVESEEITEPEGEQNASTHEEGKSEESESEETSGPEEEGSQNSENEEESGEK